MVSLFLVGLFMVFGVFSLVKFKFISVLLLLENLKVLLLLFAYYVNLVSLNMGFLIFMLVATMEVTLSLVSLTRLWDSDCLSY